MYMENTLIKQDDALLVSDYISGNERKRTPILRHKLKDLQLYLLKGI